MSEYWVSQGRRMCTYCKCWTADNKASIDFHEQGKNHKENVKKKLDELRRKGIDDSKKRDQEQVDLAMIEKAALQALKRDIASDPSIAASYGISADKVDTVKKAITNVEESERKAREEEKAQTSKQENVAEPLHYKGDWYTTVDEQGYTYYWNQVTNETSWDPPPDQPPKLSTTRGNQAAAYGQWQVIKEDEEPLLNLQLPSDSSNYEVNADEIPLPSDDAAQDPTEDQGPAAKKFKEKVVSLGKATTGPCGFKKRKVGKRQNRRQNTEDS